MKSLKVCVLLIVAEAGALALVVSPLPVRAQSNPPFQNPALDSNCYFPQIGDPSQMDTILGSDTNQYLGSLVKNMGPKPGGGFGNMFIENLTPPPSSIFINYTLSEVATGPTFNLHKMVQYVQKFDPDGQQNDAASGFHLGHFRDRNHLDMFVDGIWRIYWADDNGNYDTTRFSVLRPNIRAGNFGIQLNLIDPYVTHLTIDTIDDIVVSAYSDYQDEYDTAYVLLYRGESNLYGKDTAYEDTSAMLYPMKLPAIFRYCIQADFRGSGRDDLIVSDNRASMCYYKNDPPFSISQFAQAVAKDTIFTSWQDPSLFTGSGFTWFAMHALPKARADKSVDFMSAFDTVNAQGNVSNGSIFIFRGGPDFGSHRFTLDSAAFVINAPEIFASETWPEAIADAGDMTGTGNHVLYTSARNDVGDYWWDAFFVTGKALDDKIDIYNSHPYSEWPGDTLTANSDSLEDYLFGLAWPNAPNGPTGAGALWLYYGSKQIPVHLNPQFADVKTKIDEVPKKDGAGITLSPNPANNWTVATIVWPDAEEGEYIITDMLGREVQRDQIQFLGGGQENRISFPELPQGAYAVTLVGQHGTATARMIKLAAASVPQSGTSRSFMQSLHNAAQGNVSKFPGAAPLLH